MNAPVQPKAPMMSLDEALATLIAATQGHRIHETETLSTFAALGRVLAKDVVSTVDVPPADNTSMDGYAVRAADLPAPGTVLPVSQRIPAGSVVSRCSQAQRRASSLAPRCLQVPTRW